MEATWRRWARLRGVDPEPFIRVAHGRRTSETLRDVAPELDIAAEVAVLDGMEEVTTEGVLPVPGARDLLERLPPRCWGIVTSGSRAVATLRLSTCGLPVPAVFITGERVQWGKPAPDCYRIGSDEIGVAPAHCLVIEDAPAGIAAARAAGMRVIAVCTTHHAAALDGADAVARSLETLEIAVPFSSSSVENRDSELLVRCSSPG